MAAQKKSKMYVVIPKFGDAGNTQSSQLIKVSELKELSKVCPTEEALQVHFQAERVRLQIAKQKKEVYAPQPLCLAITADIYKQVVDEIKAKVPAYTVTENIVLTLANPVTPCCVITCIEFIKHKLNP